MAVEPRQARRGLNRVRPTQLTYREIALFLIGLGVESGESDADGNSGGLTVVMGRIRKDVERLKKDRRGSVK